MEGVIGVPFIRWKVDTPIVDIGMGERFSATCPKFIVRDLEFLEPHPYVIFYFDIVTVRPLVVKSTGIDYYLYTDDLEEVREFNPLWVRVTDVVVAPPLVIVGEDAIEIQANRLIHVARPPQGLDCTPTRGAPPPLARDPLHA